MRNLEILYEDNSVIVINKPAGLAVQGGKGIKTSLDKILAEIRTPAPLLVHRLDRDTSGVLLAAKTKEAAAVFSRLLGNAFKQYIAICAGCPKDKEGIITQDIPVHGKMKKSQTKYKVIKADNKFSILELKLETGRMHQIRRHLAMIGNPILGDDKYGNFPLNKDLRLKRLLLHAHKLTIKEKNINLTVQAPLPDYFNLVVSG